MARNNLLTAIAYGSVKMEGITRKFNGRDYFRDHCMRLLANVACDPVLGDDEDAAIIIVLHDVVEDCTENETDEERQVLYDEITELFGHNVTIGVMELTDEYTKARHPEKNRRQRKELELERQKGISDRGKRLKLHDRNVNLEDTLAEEDWNMTYAQESWDLGFNLSDPENFCIASKVLAKAALLRDKCNENKKKKK